MSEVRKDKKGRKLRENESQDKERRYLYKYYDAHGKWKTIYSWKLTSTDTIPKGKRSDISLREKEKLIEKDREDGVVHNGDNIQSKEKLCRVMLNYTKKWHELLCYTN